VTAILRTRAVAVVSVLLAGSDDARQIIAEAQRRTEVTSQRYEGALKVIDGSGKITSEKRWTYDRAGSAGNSKVVIRFTAPAAVKDVALLVMNHPDRAADQWMWTPALNRERRIALQDRRTRFFGTDFSFEDLEERDVDHDTYMLLGEETVGGDSCWKIEAQPREGRRSQYMKSVIWIRKATYSYAQIENFDQSRLVRRLKYLSMEPVQGIWTAKVLDMEDFTRHSRTALTTEALKYNAPVKDDQFSIPALRRG
jgi:hypothetical protein